MKQQQITACEQRQTDRDRLNNRLLTKKANQRHRGSTSCDRRTHLFQFIEQSGPSDKIRIAYDDVDD